MAFLFRDRNRSALPNALLRQPLGEAPIAVIDTETTGFFAHKGDAIIAVGYVIIVCGEITEYYEQLVNPGQSIPALISELTGISDAMVSDQPDIVTVLQALFPRLANTIIAGHHVGFDLGFISRAWRKNCTQPSKGGMRTALSRLVQPAPAMLLNPYLDIAVLTRCMYPCLPGYSLDALMTFFQVGDATKRHTALGDAAAAAQILIRLMHKLEEEGINTLNQVRWYIIRRRSEMLNF